MTEEANQREHSTYSASGSSRWVKKSGCPGSVILSKFAPPRPSNAAAEEGTRAHELLERVLSGEVQDWLTDEYPPKAHEGVKHAVELVRGLMDHPAAHLLVEERLAWEGVDWLPPEDAVYGYCDAIVWQEETLTLHVIDYKHGRNTVRAIENTQLLQYGCSALQKFPDARQMVLYIVQPFGFELEDTPDQFTDDDAVSAWAPSLGRLIAHDHAMRAAIEANALYYLTGDLGTLELKPSAANCRWCSAFAICPKTKEVPDNPAFKRTLQAIPAVEFSELLPFVEYLKGYVKDAEETALQYAKQGLEIPGYKLVQRKGHRKFVDDENRTVQALVQHTGLPEETFFEKSLRTPAAAERVVKSQLKAKGVEKGVLRQVMDEIAKLADRPSNSQLELVKFADGRPSIQLHKLHQLDKIQSA